MRARRVDIELLRVISTFLIVWYHCPSEAPSVAYAGLVFFVVASAYFSVSSNEGALQSVFDRVRRILTIWIVWYCIYLLHLVLVGKFYLYVNDSFGLKALVGPSIHLWYLPFLACLILVAGRISPLLRRPFAPIVLLLFYLALMLSAEWWRGASIDASAPLAQYAHALPAVLLGWIFFALRSYEAVRRGACLAFLFLSSALAWGVEGVGLTYLIGMALATPLLFSLWRLERMAEMASVSKYTLGIYLVHPLVIKAARRIAELDGVALAAVAFGLSLGFVAFAFKHWPKLISKVM